MKKLLIGINCVLAFFLVLSVWGIFSGSGEMKLEVGKKKSARKAASVAASATAAAPAKFKIPSSTDAAAVIVNKNVFDPQRTGGTVGRGAVTYQLVGIYRVKKSQGAIILIKGGRNLAGTRQFFRLGDELPNGYSLAEISGNQAILKRGSSRMTLDLAMASENNTVRRNVRRNNNPMQQMLNLMRQSVGMQQMQQMNMMRMMRNNQNNSTPARRGSTNSRRR